MGVVLAGLGRFEEAIAAYERALAIDSNIPAAHYNIAGLLVTRGETKRALWHYQQALDGNDAAARSLARSSIEQLRLAQ